MAYHKPKHKRKRRIRRDGTATNYGRFVQLHFWMLNSLAWQYLPPMAQALYIQVKKLYMGDNNGDLYMSARLAAQLLTIGDLQASEKAKPKVSKNTGHNMLRELQAKGFIRPNKLGYFSVKYRHATSWILTEYPHAGKPATKDFMHWRPTHKKQNTVSLKDTPRPSEKYTESPNSPPPETPLRTPMRDIVKRPLGISERHTSNIPGGEARNRKTTASAAADSRDDPFHIPEWMDRRNGEG